MRNPYVEEYQNNTVSQISGKISCMCKQLKPGILFSACERRLRGYSASVLCSFCISDRCFFAASSPWHVVIVVANDNDFAGGDFPLCHRRSGP